MKTVKIDEIEIGSGIPKICIPIMGRSQEEVVAAAKQIPEEADLVELRLDYFTDCNENEAVEALLREVQVWIKKPLLVTVRTQKEGGMYDICGDNYHTLLKVLIAMGGFAMLDIEYHQGMPNLQQYVEMAHQKDIRVIMSFHDFDKTPEAHHMTELLKEMEQEQADIAKIAVMPRSKRDVLELMKVTCEASELLEIPVVTMSMGAEGMVSRMTGEIFGSSITFGCHGAASAPGQVESGSLHDILQLIHDCI